MKINIDEKKDNKISQDVENKQLVREVEEFFTTGKVSDMLSKIEEQKKEIVQEMIEYKDNIGKTNPIIINNYFFKPITPIASQEPQYSAEQLGMIFDYYCYLISEVNVHLGVFPSSLTSFCKLAGITLSNLRQLRTSSDYNMRVVVEKIYDQIGDENITLSQMDYAKERTTMFKLKAQNELVEKAQPKININITEKPDMQKIGERIGRYKKFSSKKGKYNG